MAQPSLVEASKDDMSYIRGALEMKLEIDRPVDPQTEMRGHREISLPINKAGKASNQLKFQLR